MNATLAALDVIEASLAEQLPEWASDAIWRHWIENTRAGLRVYVSGREVEMSGVRISVPWARRRRLRLAVERWAAKNAIARIAAGTAAT